MKKLFLITCWCILATSCFSQQPTDHEGILLCERQGLADWSELEADKGISIAYLDASIGAIDRDIWYEYNLRNAHRNALPIGSAHHLTTENTMAQQAENFKGAARKLVQDLVPMVIIDEHVKGWSNQQVQDSLLVFMDVCRRYYGKYPMIAASRHIFSDVLSSDFTAYHRCLLDGDSTTADSTFSIWIDQQDQIHMLCNLADLRLRYPRDMYFQENDSLPDGIDVSKYQKTINWDGVATAKNIRFAIIRATLGTETEDEQYARNVREARRVGIMVGAYHFLSTKRPVRDQFAWFYEHVRREDIDLPPMLDVEEAKSWSGKQLRDSIDVWVALCEKYYGVKPIIYSYQNFYNEHLCPFYQDHILFLAKYSSTPSNIYTKGYGQIWQYSCKGRVPGIDALVDLSKLHRSVDLEAWRLQPFEQPTDKPVCHHATSKKK